MSHLQKQSVVLHDKLVEWCDVGEAEAGAQPDISSTRTCATQYAFQYGVCFASSLRSGDKSAILMQQAALWSVLGEWQAALWVSIGRVAINPHLKP